jgi:hypothetical protein
MWNLQMLFKFMWNISCNSLGGENISTHKPYLGLYGNLPINKSYFLFVGLLQLTSSSAYLTSQDWVWHSLKAVHFIQSTVCKGHFIAAIGGDNPRPTNDEFDVKLKWCAESFFKNRRHCRAFIQYLVGCILYIPRATSMWLLNSCL